jgi:hypothetical protein
VTPITSTPPSTPSRSWRWVAVVLLVVGVGSLVFGLRGGSHALPAPAPSAAAEQAAAPVPAVVATLATTRSVPTMLHIPAIGMAVPLTSLGVNADGSVQVPDGIVQPGWFRLGPTPGQVGSAVILGHVDNYTGPGVFFNLRTLAPNDRVFVSLADGETAVFVVNTVATYSKSQFPSQRVYGSHGSSALQLVTCGGVFDHQSGSYLSNVVVYTSLMAVIPGVPT